MRSYVIGRSPHADIVLPDPSVARRHAELVATDDGRVHLTDCDSEGGTWRRLGAGAGAGAGDGTPRWERLRQAFLDAGAALRFGEHETTARSLLAIAGVPIEADPATTRPVIPNP